MGEGNGNAPKFGIRKKMRQIGRTDVAGGGQVVVEKGYAFIGHMDPPHGTSILDVKDPKHPKIVAHIEVPPRRAFAQSTGERRHHAGESGKIPQQREAAHRT